MLTELLRERARREAVQKALIVNGLPLSKGKKLPPGTVRTWKGQVWKKVAEGKWEKVKGEKKEESSYRSGEQIEREKSEYRDKAMEPFIQRATKNALQQVRWFSNHSGSKTLDQRLLSEGLIKIERGWPLLTPKGKEKLKELGGLDRDPSKEEEKEMSSSMRNTGKTKDAEGERPKGYAAVRAEAEPKEEEARKKFRSLPAKEREGMGEKPSAKTMDEATVGSGLFRDPKPQGLAAEARERGVSVAQVMRERGVARVEPKGEEKPTTPEGHAMKIARDTLRMPDAMAGVMGGPSKAEARKRLGEEESVRIEGKKKK